MTKYYIVNHYEKIIYVTDDKEEARTVISGTNGTTLCYTEGEETTPFIADKDYAKNMLNESDIKELKEKVKRVRERFGEPRPIPQRKEPWRAKYGVKDDKLVKGGKYNG